MVRGLVPAAQYNEDASKVIVDVMPIRNGRWMVFTPEKSGRLRQLDVMYLSDSADIRVDVTLKLTMWSGEGITASVFLDESTIIILANASSEEIEASYVRFPVSAVTLSAGDQYTWQVTASSSDVDQLGSLGYVRGNGYASGIGDLAWDYLFTVWVEGDQQTNAGLAALSVAVLGERPWFEIWCVMIMVLALIFMLFLCLLHWKRVFDEERERKEDRKFQAELRQRAVLQAETERKTEERLREMENEESDGDESDAGSEREEEEEYVETGGKGRVAGSPGTHLGDAVPSKPYTRVISNSTNDLPANGTEVELAEVKKSKKKPRKKKKRKKQGDEYASPR